MRSALIILLVLVGGCKKSSDKSTINTPNGSMEIQGDRVALKTKDGNVVMGSSELPEGCPILLMDGASIEGSTHMTQPDGAEFFQLSISTTASLSDVAAFYEKMLKDKGVSVSRTEQSDGSSQIVMLTGSAEGVDASALIGRDRDSEQTSATISWSGSKK